MKATKLIGEHIKIGDVRRREELTEYSNSLDRDLRKLVDTGELRRLWKGVYYRPESSVLGEVPPEYDKMLKAFLRSDDFLIVSPNMYNSLRVGTTQLYNIWLIYNHTRSGRMKVYGQSYHFLKSRRFPKKPDMAFHYVDLINNLRMLEEDHDAIKRHTANHAFDLGINKMRRTARAYGKPATIKFFEQIQPANFASA